jgi:DNA-binding PadR family transcriptional regulator
MTKEVSKKDGVGRSKETLGFVLSFCTVRILYYASAGPVSEILVLERLRGHGCPLDEGTVKRMLVRMKRSGWLKSGAGSVGGRRTGRDYSLTSKGRKALDLAREHLKVLVESRRD